MATTQIRDVGARVTSVGVLLGVVSKELLANEATVGLRTYESLQSLGLRVDKAKALFDVHSAELTAAVEKQQVKTRKLNTAARAFITLSEVFGVATSKALLALDTGDPMRLSRLVEARLRDVPGMGEAFADSLVGLREDVIESAPLEQGARATKVEAERQLLMVLYQLHGALNEARAELAQHGVRVVIPRAPRAPKAKTEGQRGAANDSTGGASKTTQPTEVA
ncbi:MAG: hypothetical protein JNG84_07125 [Archangium sp.]|nr:hypothetical protein [Archangium sp.]